MVLINTFRCRSRRICRAVSRALRTTHVKVSSADIDRALHAGGAVRERPRVTYVYADVDARPGVKCKVQRLRVTS